MFCSKYDTNLVPNLLTMLPRIILNNIYTISFIIALFCVIYYSIISLIHFTFSKRSFHFPDMPKFLILFVCCSSWSIYNFARIICLHFSLFSLNNTALKLKFSVKENIYWKNPQWETSSFMSCTLCFRFFLSKYCRTDCSKQFYQSNFSIGMHCSNSFSYKNHG